MNLSRIAIFTLGILIPLSAYAQTHSKAPSDIILQGGDDISSAYPITYLPFYDAGTTIGFTDNYDGPCSGNNGSAPDVVYSYTPSYDEVIMVSLCQSSNFDTRLYVFEDSPSNVVACNDDACSYLSQLDCLVLYAGHIYYFVVDGYGTSSGNYSFDINLPVPGVSITSTVHNTDGDPISGANIWILDTDGQTVWHDTTDLSGSCYTFGLMAGNYTVEAAKPGYITQIQGPINILECDPAFVDFFLEAEDCIQISSPDAIIEDEPECYDNYHDIYNIGCSETIWDTIPATCEFYGTSGDYLIDGLQNRDTDWLEFELADSSQVILKGVAEYNLIFMIIKQGPEIPCEGFEMLNWQNALACDTAYIETSLAAGKYWIWVAPQDFDGVACGSLYYLSLHSQGFSNCDYIAGDVNNSSVFNGIDVVYAVGYFKGAPPPPYSCYCHGYVWYVAGDFNGDCQFNGLDITRIVGHLKGFWGPGWCPDCPPRNAPH